MIKDRRLIIWLVFMVAISALLLISMNWKMIAYIDDECKAPPQWLATAKRIIDRLSPAVFGGPYYGYHNSLPPRWWKESYEAFEPCDTARAL